ncbi:MAG: undecaprenyl-diphosphate phosphatase [Candidatus Cloacimonetes bacterium]|jgi:undecaprenyl-diphosphatase|nr:undecaprenyl-diphosphate phosphatase [Candidatus Cloacimonadota bacterium]
MEIFKAVLLGIIQGLTEFLPISSSGHLVLAEHYLKFNNPDISFEIILHLGSLFAVLLYFHKDISSLLKSLFLFKNKETIHTRNRNTIFYLLVATTVTGILGLYFEEPLTKAFSSLYIPSFMLIITGFILYISDKIEPSGIKTYQLGVKKSILIGLVQAFAILPGISRSGTTITVGIFAGLDREEAARFSFILSIPAILGANIHKFSSILNLDRSLWVSYILGTFAAFISGYAVISFLITIVKKQKLKYFAIYCWLIAIITLILYLKY